MPTVPLIDDATADPRVKAVFEDIKATKRIDWVPGFWRALANHPESLERIWSQLKSVMCEGALDLKTKEMIAIAVSATNGCRYCINSHTAAAQKLGMTREQYGELLAVVGLYNQTNSMVEGMQVEPDVFPKLDAW